MQTDPGKPAIVLAFANDRDERVPRRYLRNLPEEMRRVRDTLEIAQRAERCQLVLRPNATVDELLDLF